jgi:CRP/FNR family transcriptional regulator, cyclic AMP receptor protein
VSNAAFLPYVSRYDEQQPATFQKLRETNEPRLSICEQRAKLNRSPLQCHTEAEIKVTLLRGYSIESSVAAYRPTRAELASGKEPLMVELEKSPFDAAAFLRSAGLGRNIRLAPKECFFSQGDPADSIFYLQKGRAKVAVVSPAGKEATIALLSEGDFIGEESLAALSGPRLATAVAITACRALKMNREELIRLMHEQHDFSDHLLRFLLARSMRIQADLVDQLFNSSEKRLARILLLMAEFGGFGDTQSLLPKISQETLAEMIGTTRSRVSFFMNRFRNLGFIDYDGRIRVHKSLFNVILHDHPLDIHLQKARPLRPPRNRLKASRWK